MRKECDRTDFWIHINPQGGECSWNTVWRSKTEPIYDKTKKEYKLSERAMSEGDRFLHLNANAMTLLSKKIRDNIRAGIKIHVVDGLCVKIKNCHGRLVKPI